jgi:hypothetical protein
VSARLWPAVWLIPIVMRVLVWVGGSVMAMLIKIRSIPPLHCMLACWLLRCCLLDQVHAWVHAADGSVLTMSTPPTPTRHGRHCMLACWPTSPLAPVRRGAGVHMLHWSLPPSRSRALVYTYLLVVQSWPCAEQQLWATHWPWRDERCCELFLVCADSSV